MSWHRVSLVSLVAVLSLSYYVVAEKMHADDMSGIFDLHASEVESALLKVQQELKSDRSFITAAQKNAASILSTGKAAREIYTASGQVYKRFATTKKIHEESTRQLQKLTQTLRSDGRGWDEAIGQTQKYLASLEKAGWTKAVGQTRKHLTSLSKGLAQAGKKYGFKHFNSIFQKKRRIALRDEQCARALDKLSTLEDEKFASMSELKEVVGEVRQQTQGLDEQLKASVKDYQKQGMVSGGFALVQLAESMWRCHDAVSAFRRHWQGDTNSTWYKQMERWEGNLKDNRADMQSLIDDYQQRKDWDTSGLALLSLEVSQVFDSVRKFTNELVDQQSKAKANLADGSFHLATNVVNTALTFWQSTALGFSSVWHILAGGLYGISAVLDGVTVTFSYFDLQALSDPVVNAVVLLKEAQHQVDMLAKGSRLITDMARVQRKARTKDNAVKAAAVSSEGDGECREGEGQQGCNDEL